MRFDDGEIVCRNEDETENERDSIPAAPPPQKFVVGYALTSKKVKSFLQPKLEGLARKRGILFVAIDLNKPLSEQGPFDIVLHKLTGKEWRQILEIGHLSYSFVAPTYEEDCICDFEEGNCLCCKNALESL